MEIIDPQKLLVKIVSVLDKLEIKYFVTGGLAVSVWGRPRATFDIDIVIKLIEPKVAPLAKALRELYKMGYIDEDSAKEAIIRNGEFNFIDGETGAKVDFWTEKNSEFDQIRFQRRKAEIIDRKKVYFISPEDLILTKLEWYQMSESTRQLEDIESILKISGNKLDMNYLRKWAEKLNCLDILNKAFFLINVHRRHQKNQVQKAQSNPRCRDFGVSARNQKNSYLCPSS